MYFLAIVLLICISVGLQAAVEFNIAETIDLGGFTFGKTIRLNDTHYVSVEDHSVTLYQVEAGTVNVIDRYISTDYYGYVASIQIEDSHLYVLTKYAGVHTFDISDTALTYNGMIALYGSPGLQRVNIFMKVFAEQMIVSYVVPSTSSTSLAFSCFEVHDISNTDSPQLLYHYDLSGPGVILTNALQATNGYYLTSSTSQVFFCEQLSQFEELNILPYYPDDESAQYSFMHDDTLYLISSGPFGNSLVSLNREGNGPLNVSWIQTMPFVMYYGMFVEDDRVSFWGVDAGNFAFKIYAYTPGESNWSLNHQRETDWINGLFAVEDQYLAIGSGRITYFDNSLNPLVTYQTAIVFTFARAVNERYMVLQHSNNLLEIYDLETQSWLDFSTSYQLQIPNRSINNNQIVFYSDTHFQVLTFHENGTYTLNSFTLPESPRSFDVWDDRLLCMYVNTDGISYVIYQIQGDSCVEIASGFHDGVSGILSFYSYNHFAHNWYDLSDNTRKLSFFKITPAGNLEELHTTQTPSLNSYYVTDMVLVSVANNAPLFNISNPDYPLQISTLSLPLGFINSITADGAGHYLFGPSSYGKFIIANQDFDFITSFRGISHNYISSNKMYVLSANQLIFLEHGELTDNNDPSLPPVSEQICRLYPNPFKENITLKINVKESGATEIAIYNLKGQKVKSIYRGIAAKGEHMLEWNSKDDNGRSIANGIYLVRVKHGNKTEIHKAILIR